MAGIVNLIRKIERETPTSTLSLFTGVDGIYLSKKGWSPKIAAPDDESVIEVFHLLFEGASHDDLASIQQAISEMLRGIREYQSIPAMRYGVWLESKLIDETGTRQAFLLSGKLSVGDNIYASPVAPGNLIQNAILTLERMPYWERPFDAQQAAVSGDIASLGGTLIVGDVAGDIGSRISQFNFRTGEGDGLFYEGWIAFRSDLLGSVADFKPIWECEGGTLGTDASVDSISEPDTASPGSGSGSFVEIDFLSETGMDERLMLVNRVPLVASPADQRGTHQVLLRAKVGASTECRVKLLTGYGSGSDWSEQERVVIDSIDWKLYNLGQFQIPAGKQYSVFRALRIDAELSSGSGSLMLDCIGLLPLDESAFFFTGAEIDDGGSMATVEISPDEISLTSRDNVNKASFEVVLSNYCMPVGSNVTVFYFIQQETAHVLSDTVETVIYYENKWSFLRGAS